MKLINYFKELGRSYLALAGEPKALARGTSLGTALAVMPLVPLRTIIITILSLVIRANPLVAVATASIIANPFFVAFWYYAAAILGTAVTPLRLDWERISTITLVLSSDISFQKKISSFLGFGIEAITVLLAGGLAMAIPLWFISYGIAIFVFGRARR